MKIINLTINFALVFAISGSITGKLQKPARRPAEKLSGKGFRVAGGLVNSIEGEVQCVCSAEASTRVRAGQEFADGDTVQVGNDGRVEILLSPGYYLRLFNNTRARLVDLSPGNLKIRLLSGSAIVEVSLAEPPGRQPPSSEVIYAPITVTAPPDEYAIARGGAYRFNVNANAGSNVRVLKGLVVVAGSRVTDGMIASIRDGRVELTSADKTVTDPLDNWSRDRSNILVQANKSLKKADWYKQIQGDRAYLELENPEEIAQADTRRTVSARNGFVAFVESAAVLSPGDSGWKSLKAGDILISGARVRTAVENRAELHPYPNFYFYLGSNTEIVYSETEDGHVSVAVVRGSVIVIARPYAKASEQNALTLIAEKMAYEIPARGRYRLNVIEGRSEMLVYDGGVKVAGNVIKAAKKIVGSGTGVAELPLDKLALDSFDIWSDRRMLLPALVVVRRFFGQPGGLWLQNKSTGEYTFVPARWDYSSPYGGKYSVKYSADSTWTPRGSGGPPPEKPFPPFGGPPH